ncbi:MAG: DUF1330 domain-containing protein [Pseudomonadota bacterium]
MPKAYWVAHSQVIDADQYRLYADQVPDIVKQYNGHFLARGGHHQQIEGQGKPRNIIIEFNTMQDALNCYHSDAYQKAKKARENAGHVDIVIVEGL